MTDHEWYEAWLRKWYTRIQQVRAGDISAATFVDQTEGDIRNLLPDADGVKKVTPPDRRQTEIIF
jgi:hypothetical protein